MASKAYFEWVAAGRPLEPANPVREIVERLRLAYPLGASAKIFSWYANEDHYQAEPPEDHTPYSATGWPLASPRWVVFATDVMHRLDLGVNCHELAGYWLPEARAGRMPWLKYLVWQAKLYHSREGFLVAHQNSGHYDHIHLSVRTDYRYGTLGAWDLVPAKEKTMKTMLVTGRDDPQKRVFHVNGLIRVHVADVTDYDKATGDFLVLSDTRWVSGSQMLGTLTSDKVSIVDDLDAFGVEVPKNWAGRLASIEQKLSTGGLDPAVIVDAVKTALKDPAVLAAIAEAVRPVVDSELDEQALGGADKD